MTNTTNYSFKAYCNMTLEYTDTSGIILKPTINAVFRMNNNTLVNQTTA